MKLSISDLRTDRRWRATTLSYDLLGVVCGMDAANAKRNQVLGLEVLEQALATVGCLPAREFSV